MAVRTFELRCENREVADEVIEKIEEMELIVEPYGERSKKRHKKSSALRAIVILASLPREIEVTGPEITAIRQKLNSIVEGKSGLVSLVL